jgi:hypothetical protein
MTSMIPERCPAKATEGERRLFRILHDSFPDAFFAWYEPDIRGRYPDFTLLGSSFGLLTLEVKGWYPGQLSRVTDRDVELLRTRDGATVLETHAHPYRQVREYMFRVKDRLAEEALLCHMSGPFRGRLCFPCGCAVVLTNITRGQLDDVGLTRLFPRETTLTRDELDTFAADAHASYGRLKQFFSVDFPFLPLTDDQIQTIRGVLHPEVVVRARPATISSLPPSSPVPRTARVLDVLDRTQERLARNIGDGHHIIAGVAGSGKTVLLLARARLVAQRDPSKRVLVLCYNRTLATWLRSCLGNDPALRNVEVASFRQWAERRTRSRWQHDSEGFRDYEERLGRLALDATGALSDDEKYDALLIDEGQDFHPDWLRAAVNTLKGDGTGDLLIAVDGAQSVYGRPRSFTWKSVGVDARGRTKGLSKNYRNTKQIIELAWDVTQAGAPKDDGSEPHARVRPTRAARNGPKPHYLACSDWADERARVSGLVCDWLAQGIRPDQIGILYPRHEGQRIELLYDTLRAVGSVNWITNVNDPGARDQFAIRHGVQLSTIHSAKGLQFPAVILVGVDQFPNPIAHDEEADRNLLYVGMTRAEEILILTWCRPTAYTERIRLSPKAESYL